MMIQNDQFYLLFFFLFLSLRFSHFTCFDFDFVGDASFWAYIFVNYSPKKGRIMLSSLEVYSSSSSFYSPVSLLYLWAPSFLFFVSTYKSFFRVESSSKSSLFRFSSSFIIFKTFSMRKSLFRHPNSI